MEAFNTQLLQFFDRLLWISIQSSVLIILIVLVQLILRRRLGIRWHYFLWGLLLIRLAMPWLPESKISIFNLVPRSVQQGRIIESFSKPQNTRGMGFYFGAESEDIQDAQQEESSKFTFVGLLRKLPLLWLIGVLVMAAYVCVRNISLWLTVKRERPITDQDILDLLEDCKMEMGVQTILGVVVSDKIKSPALFGFVRPRLLLPQGMLETYGLEELRYVFIHELAHLRQRDIYFGWLMALLQIAHWFNPLMWFAFGRMRADRELACDGLAISMMGADEPPRYGQTIVNVLENFSQVQYVPSVAGILEDKSQIERRIKMIAKFKKVSHPRWAGAMLLLAVLACVVLTNAYIAKADFTFGEPTNMGPPINTSHGDVLSCFSSDGLEMYFTSDRPGGEGAWDIWVTTRATKDDPWGAPANLGLAFNSSSEEATPVISYDGLELYFCSNCPGGEGTWDIWVTTRATVSDPWGTPVNLGPPVNTSGQEHAPRLSTDGLELYFSCWERPGGYGAADIWVTRRATVNDPWGEPVNLGPVVNSSADENCPFISVNGLSLFFSEDYGGPYRPGGFGNIDMWVTTRASFNDPWETPLNLGPIVNGASLDAAPLISPDGSMLYFSSERPGGFGGIWGDIYQARVIPIVDFNGDGIVDGLDICMMVDFWHTDEPLYDIAPLPFGDGIVDVKDLVLLAEHLTIKEDDPNEPDIP